MITIFTGIEKFKPAVLFANESICDEIESHIITHIESSINSRVYDRIITHIESALHEATKRAIRGPR